ncbi:MAG TPA: hypothetical protein VKQ72_13175, partial [Aggregatilineales bacterium]|nr:hypothetical protein [Aggregatilineales bacterium]
GVAFTGFRHGLPYIDFPDEMTIWTMGRATFDPTWTMFQPQYPPGLLAISSAIQRIEIASGNPYPDPAATIEAMRFTSVCAFTLALMLTMLVAYRMQGPLAATIAGLCWLAVPLANYQAKVATIDAWVCLWFITSIAAGVEGFYRRSVKWIVLSLALAIIATLFKWQSAAALGMSFLACTVFWRSNRRLFGILAVALLAIIGAFSYWVVFIHKALEGGVYLPGTTTSFPTLATLLENLRIQLAGVGPGFMFGLLPIAGLLLALLLAEPRKRLYGQMGLWTFPLVILAFDAVISFAGSGVYRRHYLAEITLQAILAGIAVSLLWQWRKSIRIVRGLGPRLNRAISALPTFLVLILFAVQWFPMISESLAMDAEMVRPDRRAAFANWANSTATDGPLLVSDPLVDAAIQTLYGYKGRALVTPYNQGTSIFPRVDDITAQMIAAKNIRYVILPPYVDITHIGVPLTRLIAYDAYDPRYRGSEWAAYYVGDLPLLPPDQVASFGGTIFLRGYSLLRASPSIGFQAMQTDQVCPGESLALRWLWSAGHTPDRYYSFFLHLSSDKTGEISAPINGQQPVSDARPTITWNHPDELLVGPLSIFSLPKDLSPGKYELWLGLFDANATGSGAYLTLPDGKHYHVLTSLAVGACPSS